MLLNIIKRNHPIAKIIHKLRNRKLKNRDFSIFAINCWGGVLYNIVNQKFMSPTINARFDSTYDYIKFLKNARYYLSQPINFLDETEYNFPVGMIGDIKILFVHYHSNEEAELKWEERKKRINWDNLYIMAHDYVDDNTCLSHAELLELASVKAKNIVVFTSKHYDDIPYCFYVGRKGIMELMNTSMITGLRKFETKFDYISWLNAGN
jgi:uncharacterized protein (DUF1919 family)